MVSGKAPPGVVPLVVLTVMVVEPAPVSVAGLKVAVAPAGRPLTGNPMLLLNPLSAGVEMLYWALAPTATVCGAVELATVKSGICGRISMALMAGFSITGLRAIMMSPLL